MNTESKAAIGLSLNLKVVPCSEHPENTAGLRYLLMDGKDVIAAFDTRAHAEEFRKQKPSAYDMTDAELSAEISRMRMIIYHRMMAGSQRRFAERQREKCP